MKRRTTWIATAIAAGIAVSCVTGANAAGVSASVKAFAEPQAGITPVLSLINQAHSSIDLTMYELTDTQVERALVAAHKRGVEVRVLLNRKDPFESSNPNASAFQYLQARGVQVRYAPSYFALTHQKTLTIDNATSAILTMNLAGDYSSTRDFGIVDSQPADVKAIVSTFNADWADQHSSPSTGTGDLVWSPGAATAILSLINGAHTSLDVENEEMDYRTATSALCAASHRGVNVKVVMTYDSEWASAFHELQGCGVNVHVFHGQAYYIHAKVLIADGDQAFVGSQNLSTESLGYNRELGVTVRDASVLSELQQWFAHDYANGATY